MGVLLFWRVKFQGVSPRLRGIQAANPGLEECISEIGKCKQPGGEASNWKPGNLAAHHVHPSAYRSGQPEERPARRPLQVVVHSRSGEGTILMRESEGEDAKFAVMFHRHDMKKLIEQIEKFANLRKL